MNYKKYLNWETKPIPSLTLYEYDLVLDRVEMQTNRRTVSTCVLDDINEATVYGFALNDSAIY